MPLSIRLDSKTEHAVKRLARRPNQTRSAVVREAITAFERAQEARLRRHPGPWEAIAHLLGTADSGGGRLSEDTGEGFRALIQRKTRARRAG